MQAPQITIMITSSVATPSKMSVSTRSSTLMEGFSLGWHREILAARSLSAPALVIAKTGPEDSALNENSLSLLNAAKAGENASGGKAEDSTPAAQNQITPLPPEPNTVVPPDAAIADIPTAHANAGRVATVVTETASSNANAETKKGAMANSAEVVNPQVVTFTDVTAAPTRVEGACSAPTYGVDVLQNQGRKNSGLAKTVSPTLKPDRTSECAETVNNTAAKPSLGSVESLPSKPAKLIAKSAIVPFPCQDREAAASPVPSKNEIGLTPIPEAAPSTLSGSHLYQQVDSSALTQTITPNHATLSSARVDLQLFETNVLDAAGVKSLHFVPSVMPAQLDVGVLDGTHGWLRIRAELDSGGDVIASLTASALAHDSLRAALPEMVKYLGAEAISVTDLSVHRFAASANNTSSDVATNQQSGDTRGHDPRGDTTNIDGGDHKHQQAHGDSPATRSTPTNTSGIGDDDDLAADRSVEGMQRISRAAIRQTWPFGVLAGTNGSWLSVCA